MNLKSNLKRRKNYVLLIIAYIAFILISLCVGILYYSNMKDSMAESMLRYNQSMISLMKSNVDRTINEVNFTDYYIEIDSTTKKIVSGETISQSEKYNYMYFLNRIKQNSKLIDDVCVYLENEDIIVSSRGVLTSRTYFDIQCKMSGYTYEQWKEKFLLPVKNRDFYPVEKIEFSNSVSQDVIIYKRSLYGKTKTLPAAHILMLIKTNEMTKDIDVYGSECFIIDKSGNVILGNKSTELNYTPDKLHKNEKDLLNGDWDRAEVYEESDNSNLIYAAVLDKELILYNVNNFAKMGVVLVVLYLLLGVVFFRFVGNLVYSPIKRILKKIENENNGQSSEIEMISTKIDDLMRNESKYLHQIKELSDFKKKTQLRAQLKNTVPDKSADLLNWQQECFMVMVVRLIVNNILEDEEVQTVQLIKYAALNILDDLLDKSVRCETAELENNYIAVVFNFREKDAADVLDNIYLTAKIMTDILEREFNVMMNISVSECHKNPENLNLCFNEAMAALDFRFADDGDVLIRYDMINNNNMSASIYYWPSEIDEIFTAFINNGDYKSIEKIIDEIIKTNMKNGKYAESINDYIYYNLLGTFLRIASGMMNYKTIKKIKYREEMTPKENIDVIKKEFEQLCSISSEEKPAKNSKLLESIEAYVDGHFCENSLDLVSIADNLQISVQYLTTYFKKHKNTTLLKYITQKRIDYSKELLMNTDFTINDIALKVGYTDASVFTKVFKKTENTTPGKYRTLLKENK